MPYVGKSMDRRRNARRCQLSGAHTAVSWNAAHPVGTRVRYWPIYPPIGSVHHTDTVTRSEAWTIGDGSVVVCIDGMSGGVALSHIEVLAPHPLAHDVPHVEHPPASADGQQHGDDGEGV